MVTDAKTPAKEDERPRRGLALATLAYAAIVAALIAARALVDALAFVSLGWIIVLGVIPLVPWLVPAVAPLFRRIAPFVQHVTLPGGFEIALSAAARPSASLGPVEATLTSDHLVNTPFTTTHARTLIQGVQSVRAAGAECVTVDLANGQKWRLPNLYFLAWILANGPTTRWLVFIETRADVTNAYVGLASAARLLNCVETAYPEYKVAATRLEFHDPSQLQNQAPLAKEFNKMRGLLAPAQAGETATLAWVTAADVRKLFGPHLVRDSVGWTGSFDRKALDVIVRSPVPYIAATIADGEFRGLIDQRDILVELARRVLDA